MSNARPVDLVAANALPDYVTLDMLVAPTRRSAAEFGARKATERLGGQAAAIKFFRRSPETGSVDGGSEVGASTIYVASDLTPAGTAGVAAPEATPPPGLPLESKCFGIHPPTVAEWLAFPSNPPPPPFKQFEPDPPPSL